jgi:PmbA protein
VTTKNPHRRLVRISETPRSYRAHGNPLDLEDPNAAMSLSELRHRAYRLDELAHASLGAANVEGASTGCWSGISVFATSTGFLGITRSTSNNKHVSIIARNDKEMQSGSDGTSAAYMSDLRSDEECVRRANWRARRMLGAGPIKSGIMPVILENEIAGAMMRALFSAIDADEVHKGSTFLREHLGEMVMSKDITIVEEPHIPRRLGSAYFDAEGVATVAREIISGGRLTTWASNIESAEKLGIAPTGHSGGFTRLTLKCGKHSLNELVAGIDRGILVTGMMGNGINVATGSFSVGAEGFLIERGMIVRPVNKITIAGNLLDMWKTMIAGSDTTDRQGSNSPSLLIEKMTVGGE